MTEKTAIEFLFYSYFGVGVDEDADIILDALINKAYSDATQQGAYNMHIGKSDLNLKEKSEKCKKEAIKIIKEKIEEYKGDSYDDWVKDVMGEVEKEYKDIKIDKDNLFSYGNAQKWVNMSVKYILLVHTLMLNISGEKNIECSFCDKYGYKFSESEKQVHIPVDSYIIEAVWHAGEKEDLKGQLEDRRNFDCEKLAIKKVPLNDDYNNSVRKNKYSLQYVKGWSKWNYTEYKNFQDEIKALVGEETPLDWENRKWIEIAKRRKKK